MLWLVTLFAPVTVSAQGKYAGSRLMTVGFDGSDPEVIYETGEVIEAPNWTLDGKWLVYNSKGKLYKISATGGKGAKPTEIKIGDVVGANNDHVLSPDGKAVYFSAKGHIYKVPLAGGAPERISNEHSDDNKLIYWLHGISPDGKIAAHCGMRDKNKDIWIIPTTGGKDQRLTTDPGDDDGPDYSPDGQWIYFNSNRSGSNQVWRLPAAGGKPEAITKDKRVNWFPHPSPDGKWIVYLSYPPGTAEHPRGFDVILRRAKPDGSGVVDLYSFFGGQGTINVPSWSPDSKRFAFVVYQKQSK